MKYAYLGMHSGATGGSHAVDMQVNPSRDILTKKVCEIIPLNYRYGPN
jgi:hypothetical protein